MHLIRPGEKGDSEQIEAIQAASPESASWPVRDYFGYDLRVAVEAGRVAGFLSTREVAPGEAEILNLAVAPECRRRGIGRALMRSFLEAFHGVVYLEVRSSNCSARRLYNSLGFQEVTLRSGYYGFPPEAAVVMKLHSC